MHRFIVLTIILSVFSLEACQQGKNNEKAELTFKDLFKLVIQDTGQPIEWHNEDLDKTAQKDLLISKEGKCGENNCGEALFMENTSDSKVEIVIQAPFQIEDVSSHLAVKYLIDPKTKIPIGCSHLCYDGESYSFERRIVGAKYLD